MARGNQPITPELAKHLLGLVDPLRQARNISQDVAQAQSMQQAEPQRQLAEQNAYGEAQSLTDQAGQQANPQDQLNLLRRAQAIYTQQGQQAQQNARGFSADIQANPLLRAGSAATEIATAAAIAGSLKHAVQQKLSPSLLDKANKTLLYNAKLQLENARVGAHGIVKEAGIPENISSLIDHININGAKTPLESAQTILSQLPSDIAKQKFIQDTIQNWGKSAQMVMTYGR